MKISWILLHIFLQCSKQKPETKIILHLHGFDGSQEVKEKANRGGIQPLGQSGKDNQQYVTIIFIYIIYIIYIIFPLNWAWSYLTRNEMRPKMFANHFWWWQNVHIFQGGFMWLFGFEDKFDFSCLRAAFFLTV